MTQYRWWICGALLLVVVALVLGRHHASFVNNLVSRANSPDVTRTYQNDLYDYTFDYPSTWMVKERPYTIAEGESGMDVELLNGREESRVHILDQGGFAGACEGFKPVPKNNVSLLGKNLSELVDSCAGYVVPIQTSAGKLLYLQVDLRGDDEALVRETLGSIKGSVQVEPNWVAVQKRDAD
jgi:hypothetical protein